MTVIPEPLPIESTHCRVRARISNIYADSADAGTGPDWRAPTGEAVTLTPGVAGELLAHDVNGPEPRVVMVEKVECVVGEEGWLKTKADGLDVYVVPTDDPLLSATGWTWTATIRGKSIKFAAPMGGVVDLAMFVAAPATDDTKTWVERIPELVALFEAGTDPAEIAAAVEDYLAANPPEAVGAALATHEALAIDGDTTLPSEHQVITLRVSSPATLSIADAPDGTVVTAHVVYGWEDITWAPDIVVQGETSTTETWLVLVRSEGQWKVLVSGESADSGGGDSGGGSIAGLNVITGSWPLPLPANQYPAGTLFVREGYDGPVMAIKSGNDWVPLASDGHALSWGEIDPSAFTSGVGEVIAAQWMFDVGQGEAMMGLGVNNTPELGDILCTFDPGTLTDVEQDVLRAAAGRAMVVEVLTGIAMSMDSGEPVGAHHLTIDSLDGVVKYLWPVGGAPLAAGDGLLIKWPVTIRSDYWESPGGGGVAT